MANLEQEYIKNKKLYREIFLSTQTSLEKKFSQIKRNCNYNQVEWQKECLNKLKNEILKDISSKIEQINDNKNNYSCAKCALCCKFAVSEFSYEELKEKAKKGDNYAKEFISIFVPYKNIEDARKIFPEYIELLEKHHQNINVYYCPKLTKDNLCPDYKNRPSICRDFPFDVLSIFPKSCNYKSWKEESEILALHIKALQDLSTFYINELENSAK